MKTRKPRETKLTCAYCGEFHKEKDLKLIGFELICKQCLNDVIE